MLGKLIKGVTRAVRRGMKARAPLAEAPDIAQHRLLFIGGLHRSGTSIVHELLREHPAVSGFTDTGVMEDEGQHLQSVFAPAWQVGGPGLFAFDPRAHLTEDSPLVTPANRDRLLREWGAYYDLGKPLLLEKSPPNLVRSRFFQAMFPNASFLFIVRHPLAVALATRKWADASLQDLLRHWHAAYSIMLADSRHLQRCRIIRYEDLVASPQACWDQVCDLAGIERFTPRQAIVDHNAKYFAIWEREYPQERAAIEAAWLREPGPLQTFGYSFGEPFVGACSDARVRDWHPA